MKLQNKITVPLKVGNEVVTFTLRRPSNQELNEFITKQLEVDITGKRIKDTVNKAREELFDKIFVSVDNLEDDIGAITPDRKDAIPCTWKHDIIFHKIENEARVEVNIKN